MKVSRASTYALYGLGYLAGQPPDRWVPLSEIGKKNSVPEKHLAKIFQSLVKAGVLRSERGAKGGFALKPTARRLPLLSIIEIVDGPTRTPGCLLHQHPCDEVLACPLHRVVRTAEEGMLKSLRKTTVGDIAHTGRSNSAPPHPQLDT
jgi:Rrf2 family protein